MYIAIIYINTYYTYQLSPFHRSVQSLALGAHLSLDHIAVSKWIKELQK